MITCVVPRGWRWYQVVAILGTAVAGTVLLLGGVRGGDDALWIIGGVWLLLAFFGVRRMGSVAWSVTIEGTEVALRGPSLNMIIPASEIRAVRLTDYALGSRRLLTFDTERLGRVPAAV